MNLFELQAQISIGINKAINDLTELGSKVSRISTQIKQSIGGDNEVNIETKKAEENIEEITDDLENFDKKLDETESNSNSSSNNMMSTFKKLGAIIATAFAVDKIIDFGKATVQAAAEVAAEEAAFTQIMGEYSDEAAAKVGKIADATGMVDTRLTPYMTSMTAKFKGLGYGVDEATDFAARGLNLAADASAFWDKSLDDSMSHLNSFINGSYEGGEAIGLFANDTQMAAYAIEKGIVKNTAGWSKLDEATKQATRLEYAENMMKQSGATGQASKESEAYANVQANLNEKWRQFKAEVGEPILQNVVIPAMKSLSDFITNTLVPAWESLVQFVKDATKFYQDHKTTIDNVLIVLGSLAGALLAAKIAINAKTIAVKLATAVTTKYAAAMAFLTSPITLVMLGIAALIAVVVLLVKNWDKVKKAASACWDWIKKTWEKASSWFNTKIVKPISNFFGNLWKNLKNGAANAWKGIKNAFSSVASWFSKTFSKAWNAVKNIFSTGGKIFNGIKDGIASVFKKVVNGIIKGINKVISVPFKAINSMLNKIRSIKVLGSQPFSGLWGKNPLNVPQIPLLYEGGVLEKGQVGLLEGNAAEAVVPLHDNKKWIRAVANDMQASLPINPTNEDSNKIIDKLEEVKQSILSLKIYLSNEVLVGELTNAYDKALGDLAISRGRGR